MKSFTAKEFSRCPAKVYEAAREDGKVEITHDRFNECFALTYTTASNKNLSVVRSQDQIIKARQKLIDLGLIPEYQLTPDEKLYIKNKKAPD